MNKTHYVKRGRRYERVNDPYCLDGLTVGTWIVEVGQHGSNSTRVTEYAYPALLAAANRLRMELEQQIDACTRPKRDALGGPFSTMIRPSASQIAEGIVTWLRKQAEE